MRTSAPLTASALLTAGLLMAGSTAQGAQAPAEPVEPPAEFVPAADRTVGLLTVASDTPRALRSITPPADAAVAVPLREIALPRSGGVLGIPEIVLAAYRNAELALASSMPGCGLSWHLLAGIGRIESAHASGGRTDAAGTTVSPIFGPALDGTLPGNEIIEAADGGYVRAVGPMQFLPSTWSLYSADGNGDGVADPHNVFDASLAAGKYLCSGGLNLRDPQQELRAVLRYNNSASYAADVLSWSAAYRTGGAPTPVTVAPDRVPPSSTPGAPRAVDGPGILAQSPTGDRPLTLEPMAPTEIPRREQPTLITLPGIGAVSCGLLCAGPGEPLVPDPEPEPSVPADLPEQTYGPAAPLELTTPEAEAPAPPPATPHTPSIELPFGVTIPLPMSPT
ncbi:lytic murein transglycosylase [Nocardia farcinica]|uniref:lytic transglycosylase domain-containing protein n=1 Tax=Nocardia farcinica TaxID=37329 RepID=UPI001892E076|nr:lytic murein transglycosylase [Nocardia farcinica]MBF6072008.1 lytic murein transglycosylase [Nocardia farcinica]MBF6141543.1 lytic murein transglycosylase [Nocardia farcinica]MBF6259168.1 lytic murein transglycosylase [Nocardia farcinica]MBF6269713.1 lytic murein transglycosylase [Nocardia farcinica]MBF6294663.1 lytic murein transglycosylase [Nocardia farcinica]